ncbi:MAG TPA: glycoside hydrolase family 2 TIM barrel-domain containing protein, partial [Armatimonadota bacterium]|nr:glycoside hydrolase family 2 TIM barrel-domain containing protein [Armatimonadota bacterium]
RMEMEIDLTKPGEFVVGCNYWASHAGTRMWAEWDPEVVERDFRLLSDAGLQLLRVFPLWPDFQPIHLLRGGGGRPVEFRHGEDPLPDDPLGQAGLSHQAMEQFATFLDLAEKYRLKLLVGLLTGWMSGRLHLPPALEGLNVLTDPVAIQWELRFIREFVGRFKTHPAIVGWDLGNECNCMASATREQAYVWAATIANAIRAADPTRPVVSGMHGLSPTGAWRITDQAELTDLLCTHPYPIFTPHCDQDPVNTIRTILHSTAESRYYADIGGKPCLCQEIGTLGPVIASEKIAADYIRSCLFSLWANDCHGLVWWCANEQTELAHAPYDWHAVERELGLLRVDGSPKPVLNTITDFRRFLDRLPFRELPPRAREAVCILTEDQDHWGVAYSTFILAKQAGFDLEFQYASQPIREAPLYLLPCLSGAGMISRRRLHELLAKVEAGATLYISLDTGLPSSFEPITGLEPQTRERRRETDAITLSGLPDAPKIPCGGAFKVRFAPTRAEVLGHEPDGNPAFSVASYGKGKVYFLGVPMEMLLTRTPGSFHTPDAPPCWQVYRHVAADALAGRAVRKQHPLVAVTEHPFSATERLIIAINLSPEVVREELSLAPGWRVGAIHYGQVSADGACALPVNDAAVFTVTR